MDNKLQLISNLFEGHEIRSVWDAEKEDYYFSVVDVISALTNNNYGKSRNYWKWLKTKLNEEGSELVRNTNQLKMKAKDGKMRETDVLMTQDVFRLIESIPSPKAEPFKLWLAHLGKKEIDNVFDPSKGIEEMIDIYLKKGYSMEWILERIKAIVNRKKLTKTWQEHGVDSNLEYAILTNEIYKNWSGMTASEYKTFKGIHKESLRDNMSDLEILITDVGEVATRELTKKHNPIGLAQNQLMAEIGGGVAYNTRKDLEKKLGTVVISEENNNLLKYIDDNK